MKRALRVPLERLAPGERALDEAASTYVARVHRLAAGDALVLFDPEAALEADAEIVAVDKRAVTVRIATPRPASVRARRAVTLIQAVGKGDKLDAIVRDATELGATTIVPALTERTVRRPGAAQLERWRRIAIEAARQAGRGDAPRVEPVTELADALEPHRGDGLAICFAPEGDRSFADALSILAPGAPVTFVVGPEGGLAPTEIARAVDAGYSATHLGPIILRTETVAAAALGALLAKT